MADKRKKDSMFHSTDELRNKIFITKNLYQKFSVRAYLPGHPTSDPIANDLKLQCPNKAPSMTSQVMRNYKRKTERGKVSIELKPLPKAPPRLSKTTKLRIRKSAILTDTPEKNALAEEKETRGKSNSKIKKQKVEKRVGKKKTAVTIKRNKKEAKDADENDSEVDSMEWYCLICCDSYSNSQPGEQWIECVTRKNWAHSKCLKSKNVRSYIIFIYLRVYKVDYSINVFMVHPLTYPGYVNISPIALQGTSNSLGSGPNSTPIGCAPLLVDDDDAIGLVTGLEDDDDDGEVTDGTVEKTNDMNGIEFKIHLPTGAPPLRYGFPRPYQRPQTLGFSQEASRFKRVYHDPLGKAYVHQGKSSDNDDDYLSRKQNPKTLAQKSLTTIQRSHDASKTATALLPISNVLKTKPYLVLIRVDFVALKCPYNIVRLRNGKRDTFYSHTVPFDTILSLDVLAVFDARFAPVLTS
ncbi:hypothetical protein HW555_012820 [Spodoptera exigua]|uniref:Uncharacterized protein n=1 Tax=Spodoptera exigua TaxID=7107 RepID=A0A835KZ90_SPOEX|nr:hypothetical protein HW555_012820 [Spodoptera exigua]